MIFMKKNIIAVALASATIVSAVPSQIFADTVVEISSIDDLKAVLQVVSGKLTIKEGSYVLKNDLTIDLKNDPFFSSNANAINFGIISNKEGTAFNFDGSGHVISIKNGGEATAPLFGDLRGDINVKNFNLVYEGDVIGSGFAQSFGLSRKNRSTLENVNVKIPGNVYAKLISDNGSTSMGSSQPVYQAYANGLINYAWKTDIKNCNLDIGGSVETKDKIYLQSKNELFDIKNKIISASSSGIVSHAGAEDFYTNIINSCFKIKEVISVGDYGATSGGACGLALSPARNLAYDNMKLQVGTVSSLGRGDWNYDANDLNCRIASYGVSPYVRLMVDSKVKIDNLITDTKQLNGYTAYAIAAGIAQELFDIDLVADNAVHIGKLNVESNSDVEATGGFVQLNNVHDNMVMKSKTRETLPGGEVFIPSKFVDNHLIVDKTNISSVSQGNNERSENSVHFGGIATYIVNSNIYFSSALLGDVTIDNKGESVFGGAAALLYSSNVYVLDTQILGDVSLPEDKYTTASGLIGKAYQPSNDPSKFNRVTDVSSLIRGDLKAKHTGILLGDIIGFRVENSSGYIRGDSKNDPLFGAQKVDTVQRSSSSIKLPFITNRNTLIMDASKNRKYQKKDFIDKSDNIDFESGKNYLTVAGGKKREDRVLYKLSDDLNSHEKNQTASCEIAYRSFNDKFMSSPIGEHMLEGVPASIPYASKIQPNAAALGTDYQKMLSSPFVLNSVKLPTYYNRHLTIRLYGNTHEIPRKVATENDDFATLDIFGIQGVKTEDPYTPPNPGGGGTDPGGSDDRIDGDDRYETAVEVSKANYNTTDNVILASGLKYTDALTPVPFAHQISAPILFSKKDEIPKVTLDEILRLKAKKVYISGGVDSVGEKVEKELTSRGIKIERLAGPDRYETARRIAVKVRSLSSNKSDLVIASGQKFPDALTISSLAARDGIPILLSKKDSISKNNLKDISDWSIKKAYVAGGEASVGKVPVDTVSELIAAKPIRYGGEDRYETAQIIAKNVLPKASIGVFTSGEDFPDALAAGPMAANRKAPVLLVKSNNIPKVIYDYIKESKITKKIIVGGYKSVSLDVEKQIQSILKLK